MSIARCVIGVLLVAEIAGLGGLFPSVDVHGQDRTDALVIDEQLQELHERLDPWQPEDSELLARVREQSRRMPLAVQREVADQLLIRLFSDASQTDCLRQLVEAPDFFVGKPLRLYSRIVGVSGEALPGGPESVAGTRWLWLASPSSSPDKTGQSSTVLLEVPPAAAGDTEFQDGQIVGWLAYVYRRVSLEQSGQVTPIVYLVASRVERLEEAPPAELMATVRNREVLTASETEAYYRLLFLATQIPAEELELQAARFQQQRLTEVAGQEPDRYGRFVEAPDRFPVFIDLVEHTTAYQAQPVTFSGRVREVIAFAADPNPYELRTLYEVRMFPDDGLRNPAIIVCSQLPEGFPVDEAVVDGVSVTGYCFKMYKYPGKDPESGAGLNRYAPMVLASSINWQGTADAGGRWGWWLTVGLFVALAILVPGILMSRGMLVDRRSRQTAESSSAETPDFDALARLEPSEEGFIDD